MSKQCELTLEISYRFWFVWYIQIAALFCAVFDCEPSMERFEYWMKKGIKYKITLSEQA